MAFKFNPFTGNLDLVKDTNPAGSNTEIQFNDNGAFGSSANLTYDGTLNVKGQGTTSATDTLALTNSSDTNLFTMKDDGTFVGKNIAVEEYAGTIRIGKDTAPNATGVYYTAIGYLAGNSNTSGGYWTALGVNTGRSSATGSNWTAIGVNTGFSNTIGSDWSAFGNAAGFSNTTGAGWVAFGNYAAASNLTGSLWTAIGFEAGRFIKGTTTALEYFENSTYIGSRAKGTNGTVGTPTTNETVIGYAAEGNGSDTVTIGSSSVTANYFRGSLNSKGQGTTSATTTLALTNSSDVNLLTMNDDGTFNGLNIGIGENAGTIRIGPSAAASKTTNLNWVAIGNQAGQANTTGASWLALGVAAGTSNINGSFWTSIGYTSGLLNTTGSSWTAIGTNAGRNNTTGSAWTAIGRDAGRENLTGSSWVAIGLDAGRYITGTTTALQYYQNSTYIGTTTKGTNGTSGTPTTNETVIGYAAEGNGSNTVTIGSSAVTANYFRGSLNAKGQGTTSATTTLALTNSSDENLFTINDDGTLSGKNIAIGEKITATRIGENAGISATTGRSFTAIGADAGRDNTTGLFWTAIGYDAGTSNLTGGNWVAIGNSAALYNLSGADWSAIGYTAGLNNLTGNNWVAIGSRAGRYIKGSTAALEYFQNSTYIGSYTKGTNGTDVALTNNETVIGYFAEGNGSNTVTIGSSAVTDNYFNGDIHAQGNGKGILVTSPDGLTTKRIGIDNSGNLVITDP